MPDDRGPGRADLVVEGRIATLAGSTGWGWVEAIAVAGGRVVAAGRAGDLDGLRGRRTRRLVLAPDEVLLPALTDAHLHLLDAARAEAELDLSAAGSLAEGLALVADRHRALPPGRWLVGRGWAAHRFGGWPSADDLEAAAPGRPAALWSQDHHGLWVSRAALAVAAVGPETPDPPGGRIVRDAAGRPTGLLLEGAVGLVLAVVPEPSVEEVVDHVAAFARRLLALGLVGVQDPGPLRPEATLDRVVAVYRRLEASGRFRIRADVSIRLEALEAALAAGVRTGAPLTPEVGQVRFGWLKVFADGALGSRTAALLEPYEAPGPSPATGIWRLEPAALAAVAERASRAGIAVQIHAIGDAAVRAALDALEPTVGRTVAAPRIEHAQLVHPLDVARFGAAGVVASVQPIHLVTDAEPALAAWGERARRSGYPWRSLETGGAVLAFGSDAPVEPVDPWPAIEVAVTRRNPNRPSEVLLGVEEGLELSAAIRAAAAGGPRSAGAAERGRLEPGCLADAVVVPAAALREPVEPGGPLGRVRPRLILVGGEIVHEG